MRRSELFEDLYLKKNQEEKKLYIFSDIEDKRKASNETYGLYKEFSKLGFRWVKELGHWVGDYSQFDLINQLIKSHNKIRKIVEDLEKIEDFIEETDADPSAKSLILKKLDDYVRDLANATDQAAIFIVLVDRHLDFRLSSGNQSDCCLSGFSRSRTTSRCRNVNCVTFLALEVHLHNQVG